MLRRLPALCARCSTPGRPALPKLFSERGRARSGVASIEFALVAPMLFLMISGMFDTSRALILEHQVDDCARFIAISASTVAVQPDKTASMSPAVAQQTMSLIYAFMPWIRNGIEKGTRSVTLTSVAFVPITSGCTVNTTQTADANNCYNAEVAFSVGYGGGLPTSGAPSNVTSFTVVTRPCGIIPQITPTQALKPNQTPLDVLRTALVAAPDPLMIADVHYQYTPMFWGFVTGKLDFYRTAKSSVRSQATAQSGSQPVPYATYTGSAGAGSTGSCTIS